VSSTVSERLQFAAEIYEAHPDQAQGACLEILSEDPNTGHALYLLGLIYAKAERWGLAYNLFQRVVQISPNQPNPWNELGKAAQSCFLSDEALRCYLKAQSLRKDPQFFANEASILCEMGRWHKAAEAARKALAMEPGHLVGNQTLGFALMAQGAWAEGWPHYDCGLDGKARLKKSFGPDWDGSDTGTLIVYGEQGLGDEIMFASCLPDIRSRAKRVIVECDKRLEGLFRRSFPWAEVHGTRREDEPEWFDGCDAQISIGSLPRFTRASPQDCPGTPYLVADPERRLQWRALFDSWGKPVIGIAWSGGIHRTGAKYRAAGLESFRPLMDRDAVFLSLQYQDPTDEIAQSGLPVRHLPRATQTPDYDDTAALVAELDGIVSVPTTVVHLAGALGVACDCLVHPQAGWRFAQGMPWHSSVRCFRQERGETWAQTIKRFRDE
jgi:hypothetical protein